MRQMTQIIIQHLFKFNESVALAKLVSYIEELSQDDDTAVFELSEMTKLYTERLRQLGVEVSSRINSTRLEERLYILAAASG